LPARRWRASPALVAACDRAQERFIEFFTAIRNRNTRRAYAQAVIQKFLNRTNAAGLFSTPSC
jgi:hypothetical protein